MGVWLGTTKESSTPAGSLSGIAKPGVRQKEGASNGVGEGVGVVGPPLAWPSASAGTSKTIRTATGPAYFQRRLTLPHLAHCEPPARFDEAEPVPAQGLKGTLVP